MVRCLKHSSCSTGYCLYNECTSPANVGDPCKGTACLSDLVCDSKLSRCVLPRQPGDPRPDGHHCSFDSECHKDKFCDIFTDICTTKRGSEATCYSSSECKDGLECVNMVCMTGCFSNKDCPMGYRCPSVDGSLEFCEKKPIPPKISIEYCVI